ncbi:MAG: hypothetical protein IJ711_04745 [Lachnospiraceae bacterium]|nr:hypothetical protein [Lachnospiraceae bacterium]
MYTKKQRIAALAGVIALLLLYAATLVCAVFNFDGTGRMFAACLLASIAIPILLWIYIAIYGKVTKRKTIADLFPQEDTDDARQRGVRETEETEEAEETEA